MATTATITLSSGDIADNAFSISNTSTLYTAGTDTHITETTGLGRKKVATSSNTILLDAGLAGGIAQDVTAAKSAKVFIKNHNDRGDGTKWVNILLAAVDGKDIEFTCESTGGTDATETTLEYTCFYE